MQYYDVREKILSQINDPDDLLYLCSSDELSRLICSRKSFWINLFKCASKKKRITVQTEIYQSLEH